MEVMGIENDFITKHDTLTLNAFEKHYETEIREMPSDFTSHLGQI